MSQPADYDSGGATRKRAANDAQTVPRGPRLDGRLVGSLKVNGSGAASHVVLRDRQSQETVAISAVQPGGAFVVDELSPGMRGKTLAVEVTLALPTGPKTVLTSTLEVPLAGNASLVLNPGRFGADVGSPSASPESLDAGRLNEVLRGHEIASAARDKAHSAATQLSAQCGHNGPMTRAGDAAVESVEPARWERAAALFLRWREGDSRAIDELVRLMTPPLWHVVRAYGIDAALAQDVVQTTWLTLVRRHESILEPQAISGWLMMCARREAWRVGKLHRRAVATDDESLEPHLPKQQSAEETASSGEEARRLWLAVGLLDERCQRLMRIVAFEDRPNYVRTADEFEMPIGSIGPTRQRCLAKLRTLLEGDSGSARVEARGVKSASREQGVRRGGGGLDGR